MTFSGGVAGLIASPAPPVNHPFPLPVFRCQSALNMATRGISLELRRRRVWAFSYHPGTTDTGLSEPFQANVKPEKLFTPDYTVSQCLAIVDSMTEELSGGFFAFDGSRIVW